MSSSSKRDSRIAVVGMACRLPGAGDTNAFWNNLRNGVEADFSIDLSEWAALTGVPKELMDRPGVVPARPHLEGVDEFDAAFFGYSPREAQSMDPQQRMFLECSWEALENAGYDSERYEGAIGVCAGVSQSSYLMNMLQWDRELGESMGPVNIAIGNMNDSLATRVAYKLNLKGPAYAVQCFCSTSLVAIHLACQSLRSGESDMVLAGGVTIVVPQDSGYKYQEGGMLSPDGHVRTFDAAGRGMVFGNGLGVVVLKRLEDAHADGDRVRAVVLGSAINNDGSLKVGYTAPSVTGQARVVERALQNAGVHPETIGYVEAHGTATNLGDPAEIAALTNAYRAFTDKKAYCPIGSVKTNIGHLDAAAGVASFIKTVMTLEHGEIPPSLHFESPNPQIDFESSPFYVNTKLTKWESNGSPRRSGVSSFGFGGTNAHAILEQAPAVAPGSPAEPWQLLLVSARSSTALDTATQNLASHLASSEENLADVAYTLQMGRQVFDHRRFVVVKDGEDARSALGDPDRYETRSQNRHHTPVVFMFTGQGAQYVDMGRGLYEKESVFREAVDRSCEILRERASLDLLSLLFPSDDGTREAARERLTQTEITQPALFVVEYATARLLMSWGIAPEAMIGHSIGEYVAAHLSGVFELEDALTLVAERGRLMQSLPAGSMLALPSSEAALDLPAEISVASVNGPGNTVVSGPTPAIERLERELSERGIMSRKLRTSHAFHSAMMDPILDAFAERVAGLTTRPPTIPFVSNVTGSFINEAEARSPEYWSRHLRQAVRFYDGLRTIVESAEDSRVVVEVGPGNTLASFARQVTHLEGDREAWAGVVTTLRHPKQAREDREVLLQAMGRLWLSGVDIDWSAHHQGKRRLRVPLPSYPFERQRFWIDKNEDSQLAFEIIHGLTYRREKLEDWFYQLSWQRFLPSQFNEEPELEPEGRWLLFADSLGVSAELEKELRSREQTVVRVAPGDAFGGDVDSGFTIRPGERADYLRLVEALADGGMPSTVVHAFSLTPPDDARAIDDRVDEAQERGFMSLLYLAQALARGDVKSVVRLLVVTNGLFEVVGTETLLPEKATLLGTSRVIPQELHNVGSCVIDVELGRGDAVVPPRLARWILAELRYGAKEAGRSLRVVGFRGKHRWTATSEPMRLRESRAARLREEGVYLITGGLGGIGLALAEHLARHYRARLVLTGRSPLPRPEEWSSAGNGKRASRDPRVEKLLELESLGAEVLYVAADVAKPDELEAVVSAARERFGSIHGAIHSAGVPGGGIIQLKDAAEVRRVMGPKLHGTLALRSALSGEPLDFIALCSSTAAWLGGVGQVDYCGANAFLDAYAHYVNASGGPYTVSINWDTWKEVGMAVHTPVAGAMKAIRDINLTLGISPAEGADAFERILASGMTEVAVFTVDMTPSFLHGRLAKKRAEAKRKKLAKQRAEAPSPSSSVAAAAVELGDASDLEETIRAVWKKVLGAEHIGVDDNFFEIGGDSLMALQVTSLLKARLQKEISAVAFYEAPTISLLARALAPEESTRESTAKGETTSLADVGQRAETRLALMQRRRRKGAATVLDDGSR